MTLQDESTVSKQTKECTHLKCIYIILVAFRLIATTFPGYIHPDEFFQGGQELFFGCSNRYDNDQDALGEDSTHHIQHFHNFSQSQERGFFMNRLNPVQNITATWEFQHKNALRSIVPPAFMTLVPLRLYAAMRSVIRSQSKDDFSFLQYSSDQYTNGWEVWVIPRLFIALLTIVIVDVSIWSICQRIYTSMKRNEEKEKTCLICINIFASSWVTLGFLNKPFTNTLETIILAMLLHVVVLDIQRCMKRSCSNTEIKYKWYCANVHHHMISFSVGAICAMGVFTRFTFVIFAFPVVFAMLHQRGMVEYYSNSSSIIYHKKYNYVKRFISTAFGILLGGIVVSYGFIVADADFYTMQQDINMTSTIKELVKYVTPWNAFRYNSKVTNLSEHGLHPRITHAAVNLPMMYGPLAISFYLSIPRKIKSCYVTFRCWNRNKDADIQLHDLVALICCAVITVALGVLSCAPHQEPRFLLPLILPLVLLHARDVVLLKERVPQGMLMTWIIFNLILLAFFGGMHQAAVIPSLLDLPQIVMGLKSSKTGAGTLPKAIIYYHTYMPPTFLIRTNNMNLNVDAQREISSDHCSSKDGFCFSKMDKSTAAVELCNNVPTIDLKGSDIETLSSIVESQLDCGSDQNNYLLLIAPSASLPAGGDDDRKGIPREGIDQSREICSYSSDLTCTLLWSSLQITTEDMPQWSGLSSFLADIKLDAYNVQCQA